ncbi:SUMF1/EgtB/PvdO family nonheme iron enzyme [Streptomyces sp. CB03238]|uniref:formylglycine-generating enzyme family protein n=1 Tax=Streptomyces sp. CB03238 TaxID=1907777 RepID=UPI0015C4CBBC|nr:SUMF1/EgtB/PvdO family nonheme iron enzyme [Streptomyces sp. CB03238]
MVDFPGRRFTVGSPDPAHHAEPMHEVEIASFRLADRCVSAADFHAFLRDAPHDIDHTLIDCIDPAFIVNRAGAFELRPGCGDFPMIQISYWGAAAYCNWLSRLEGLGPVYDLGARTADLGRDGYRLPTEAEWEAACRDGRPDGSPPGPEECNSADAGPACRALRAGETQAGTFLPGTPAPVPVASLPPDAAGLHQMLGNVREWCHDRFGGYAPGYQRHPVGASRGAFRVVRGGSFADPAEAIGPASRMAAHEDTRCEVYGFRVVCQG